MRDFLKEKNSKTSSVFFKKNCLRFLSLKYSADFRRSRLVDFQVTQIWDNPIFTVIFKVRFQNFIVPTNVFVVFLSDCFN